MGVNEQAGAGGAAVAARADAEAHLKDVHESTEPMEDEDEPAACAMGLRMRLRTRTRSDSSSSCEEYEELALEASMVERMLEGEDIDPALRMQRSRCSTADTMEMELAGAGEDESSELDGMVDDSEDDAAEAHRWSMEQRESLLDARTSQVLRESNCSAFSNRDTLTTARDSSMCSCHLQNGMHNVHRLSASDEYMDLHVRYALNIRIVEVDTRSGHVQFSIRVEDVETKKRWVVKKSFRELALFYRQVRQISAEDAPVKRELWGTFRGLRKFRLPTKLFHFRDALNQQRRVMLDSFLRHTAALVSPAPLGPRRRKAVLLLQEFVSVNRHCGVFERCVCRRSSLQRATWNAFRLVDDVFRNPSHQVVDDAASFVKALTEKTRETRRNKLSEQKANAILKTISRKMAELKQLMLKDSQLLAELGKARKAMTEAEYDEFVEDVRHAVCGFVQKAVLIQLEDHIYESLHVLCPEDEEKKLKNKICALQTMPQSFFGIESRLVSKNDWEDARRELHNIDDYSLPLDKLKSIVRAASAIFRACADSGTANSLTSVEEFGPSLTTDEFLPIHMFVVVTTNTSKPLLTKELLRLMCDGHDVTGEIGYYLTNYEAAIEYVQQLELPGVRS